MRHWKPLTLAALSLALAFALCACGGQSAPQGSAADNSASTAQETAAPETPESLVNIVGAYYGDLGSDESYQDLCIVFDYANDAQNRTIGDPGDITVTVNGTNVYEAAENQTIPLSDTVLGSFDIKTFDYTERYTGIRSAAGYGDLLGGSDPVRMFASFLFNPNDLKTGDTIELTVGDQTATFPVADATEITMADEMMKCYPDYETAQMLGAAKWRFDTAAEVAHDITHYLGSTTGGGEEFSGMAQSMKNLFSPESGGLSVFEEPGSGFNSETHTFNTVVEGLPAYDHDKVLAGYPDAAGDIEQLEERFATLADSITDPSVDKSVYAEQIGAVLDSYHAICDTLGIGTIKNM